MTQSQYKQYICIYICIYKHVYIRNVCLHGVVLRSENEATRCIHAENSAEPLTSTKSASNTVLPVSLLVLLAVRG